MGWQDDPVVTVKARWESDPIVAVDSQEPAATPAAPMIEIRAGVPVPTLITPSANPYSAGRYPNSRIYTVGDECYLRVSDLLTGVERKMNHWRVTRVDYEDDRVEFNDGRTITDLLGNTVKNPTTAFSAPRQWNPAEFYVGKKWIAAFSGTENGVTWNTTHNMHIVKRETITVPAGTFDTFRIEGEGWNDLWGIRGEMTRWLVPGLNTIVKEEQVRRNRQGRYNQADRAELVSLHQYAFDGGCKTSADGLKRNLSVKGNCAS